MCFEVNTDSAAITEEVCLIVDVEVILLLFFYLTVCCVYFLKRVSMCTEVLNIIGIIQDLLHLQSHNFTTVKSIHTLALKKK